MRNDVLKYCYQENKSIYIVPKISDIIVRSAQPIEQFDTPLVVCKNCSLTATQELTKRIFDVVFSTVAMLILLPIGLMSCLNMLK